MTQRTIRLTADQAIRLLTRLDYAQVRQSGSHRIFRNSAGIRVTIPYHKGRILHPKIASMMLRDIGLTSEKAAEYI